ncbi:hypothetical protein AMTR_s00069p00026480 [Amborella trichopoda]|uniref:Uncharacterized protein n=1 Tax=Amborella trichopoda TaxID=13333 RepID=U5DCY3_AMBTC|nr:hypothetical protein AMTR_s00069p00026480 [Amborella trichopoda]
MEILFRMCREPTFAGTATHDSGIDTTNARPIHSFSIISIALFIGVGTDAGVRATDATFTPMALLIQMWALGVLTLRGSPFVAALLMLAVLILGSWASLALTWVLVYLTLELVR